jgi:hypothetical protein
LNSVIRNIERSGFGPQDRPGSTPRARDYKPHWAESGGPSDDIRRAAAV